MVTLQKTREPGGNRIVCEIVGLSTDTKPTGDIEGVKVTNGSTFFEMDTGEAFMFDEENKIWHIL